MKHYCGYHNPEKLGYEWGAQRDPDDERFTFLTNRPVRAEPDDVVWVITSETGTKPKIYYLCGWFVVTACAESGDPRFKYKVEGVPGFRLGPWLSLNPKEWFPGFRERQGNFGLGVNPMDRQDIYCLIDLLQREGKPVPKP